MTNEVTGARYYFSCGSEAFVERAASPILFSSLQSLTLQPGRRTFLWATARLILGENRHSKGKISKPVNRDGRLHLLQHMEAK